VPGLTHGFVARSEGARGAGDALPQAKVRRNGAAGRFDDLAGRGFMILARQDVVLSSTDRAFWQSLGGSIVRLGTGGEVIEDREGIYTRLMDEYGCDVLVKRPDYYLFGACRMAELPASSWAAMSKATSRLQRRPADSLPNVGVASAIRH